MMYLVLVLCVIYQTLPSSSAQVSPQVRAYAQKWWQTCGVVTQLPLKLPEGVDASTLYVGGSDANRAYPWMVAFVRTSPLNGRAFIHCGGALVTDKHVITAAHCFAQTKNVSGLSVYIGAHNLQEPQYKRKIRYFRVHANYDAKTLYNDLAIITLDRSIPNPQPVCLPVGTTQESEGSEVYGLGYGHTSFGGGSSEILQKGDLQVSSNTGCNTNYTSLNNPAIIGSQICAGVPDGSVSACQMDSGGPLVREEAEYHKIVGVVSFGFQCARAGFPGVHARISSYIPWILRYIR